MFEKLILQEIGCECVAEFRFHPIRKWRADYAIPEHKILIEVEGAVWVQGRHTRGAGFIKDIEKYNNATSMGYSILRTTPKELMSLELLNYIKETINNKYAYKKCACK